MSAPARTAVLASRSSSTYSQTAMQYTIALNRTFHALSDGTRQSMIEVLAQGEGRTAGELGSRFQSAQPTISKHLKVLEEAGLVPRTIDGRVTASVCAVSRSARRRMAGAPPDVLDRRGRSARNAPRRR